MMNPRDTYRAFAEFYDLYVGSFAEDLDFYESHCESSIESSRSAAAREGC
jgi:hypothetical protein